MLRMPSWNGLLNDLRTRGSTHDVVRREYLQRLAQVTGRNTIVYYSGWLQKGQLQNEIGAGFSINDDDKNGFMATIHKMDRAKGLDLILHTPGGGMAATESLVDYLRSMFGNNIRAIIPQLAMSAGTMIACSCREIIMGKESSLGPIDPQFGGLPAHGILEEFYRAAREIQEDPRRIPVWQPIIANYRPTLIGECEKAVAWANEMVKEWLVTGMFSGEANALAKAQTIVTELSDHALTKSHDRHISMERGRSLGLMISALEDDGELQDAVLSVHHACIHTLAATLAYKIIENHEGTAYMTLISPQHVG